MKKNIILSLCLLFALGSSGQLIGQQGRSSESSEEQSDEKRKEIEAQRVAYITTQLELTPEESASFWPVYNEYKSEMEAHRKAKKGKKAKQIDTESLSESEIDALVKERFAHQRVNIDIEEKYYEEFKKVLPVKKVAAFYKVNDDFRKELLRSLRGKASVERKEAHRQQERAQREKYKAERELKEAKKELQELENN